MATLRITEAELARNVHAVLEKVRQGAEVVIERDDLPVAVLRSATSSRRKISEVLALMSKDSMAIMDQSFAADIATAVENHRESLDGSAWD